VVNVLRVLVDGVLTLVVVVQCVGCRPVIRTSSSEATSTDPPSYQDVTTLQCRLDRGELVPVESVDVNDLTALTLSSVRRAEVALSLVTSLSDRMAEWSAERSRAQAQASLDLARDRLVEPEVCAR
jgi:hypothetical protein